MGVVPFHTRLLDPYYLPKHLTLGDMLFRIHVLSPEDYQAIELIVSDVFKRRWAEQLARSHNRGW